LELSKNGYTQPQVAIEAAEATVQVEQLQSNWGSAIDTCTFCGRTEELAHIKQWVLAQQCHDSSAAEDW